MVKSSTASEVIFVLPKKTRAFQTEENFAVLDQEARRESKSVAFLCSNPEVNQMAQKYNFDVLSTKTEKQEHGSSGKARQAEPTAVPVTKKDNDLDDAVEEAGEENAHDEWGKHHPTFPEERPEEPEEPEEEIPTEEEEYKEEEEKEAEIVEGEPPYGTELDESGNPIYDGEEERTGEEIISKKSSNDFQILTASVKTRGMSDIVNPGAGKNIKVLQKNKKPIRLETRKAEENISDFNWDSESSQNIWADIAKPRLSGNKKWLFFSKRGLNFSSKNFSKKEGLGFLAGVSIFVLTLIVYLTAGSAKIEIKPRSQELSVQLRVAMSPNFSSVDSSFNRIPSQLFTISKSASDEFNATAEKDAVQKSRGTITIHNEYGTSPQPLVATTRFEYIQTDKESGLVFRTLQTVTVPGMKVENDIVTPGKVNVEVIADKAGQTYNVPAGDFSIVAWREKGDTARYEKVYGRSSGPMHGGILGKAKVVSEFDYNNAKDQLTTKVKNEINESLKSQSAGLELLAAIEPKVDSIESTAEIDDAADMFTVTVNSSIMTMGFKKNDLLTLISQHIDRTKGLMIVPEKLELSYKDIAINPTKNTFEVVVVVTGNAYAKIDKIDIAAGLTGKSKTQIKDYLGSIEDIDSAKVILSPFWVKKIPKNKEKINISLTF